MSERSKMSKPAGTGVCVVNTEDAAAIYCEIPLCDDDELEQAYEQLQQFLSNPPSWAYRLIQISNAKTFSRLKGLRKRIKKFNKATEKEQELSDSMRATLRSYYRADVEKLSHLLGRDLMYWVAEPNNEENGGGPCAGAATRMPAL